MKQTFVVDIKNIDDTWKNFDKRVKYDIKKCPLKVFKTKDIKTFDEMHAKTRPDRWITTEQIFNKYDELRNKCHIYATTTAMALVSWDENTAYYLMAARDKEIKPDGSPSAILWEAMKDMNKKKLKRFDLAGANKPTIAFFKKGFGGKLVAQKGHYLKFDKKLI